MFDKISYLIMRHLEFLNHLSGVSYTALKYAINRDVERVSMESANKDKLINILIGLHEEINRLIKEYKKTERIDQDLESIFRTWVQESDSKIQLVQKIDQKILELLNQEKQETKKEIATIHTNRSKIRGYSLSNVK